MQKQTKTKTIIFTKGKTLMTHNINNTHKIKILTEKL